MPAPELSVSLLPHLMVRSDNVLAGMDPRLQQMLIRRRYGQRTQVQASADADEVVVTARVSDAAAWEAQSEVRPGLVISGQTPGEDAVVTGRIPVSRIEAVRTLPFVKSLKASRPLRSELAATIQDTQAAPPPVGSLSDGGKGTVVGIVDFGCDFAHQNFRNADGSTRLLGIWHQAGKRRATDPVKYGRFYTTGEIDAALKTTDPYASLGYPVDKDTDAEQGTHGTHVMDIAAGNGIGSGVAGMAPRAGILFVEASTSDLPSIGSDALGKSFGDSVQLLEGLEFIFRTAGARPCSINVSLGTNGGPHDGSTLVEQGIDRLLAQQPNRCVTIAASNSFTDGIHSTAMVPAGGFVDLHWVIDDGKLNGSEMEIWYSGVDRFAVELVSPDGQSLMRVEPASTRQLAQTAGEPPVAVVVNRLNDPNNHDNTIGLFLDSQMPGGIWTVRLHGLTVTNGTFHAWIERDDSGQSSFQGGDQVSSHTLGSISCGHNTLVVGSFDAHKAVLPVSWFSSAGPTRDGRQKPELSAPGHDVLAAHSRTGTAVVSKSGTSMAAPAVTGGIALLLAEAAARGRSLSIDEIRSLAIQAARQNPPSANAWDSRYGNGRLFIPAMLAPVMHGPVVAAAVPPPNPPPPVKHAAKTAGNQPAVTKKKPPALKNATAAKPALRKASKKK